MTNEERIQLILDTVTAAKRCIDEERLFELDECLWDIEALIDAGGIETLRPVLDRCKGQVEVNTREELKKNLTLLRGRAARIATWW